MHKPNAPAAPAVIQDAWTKYELTNEDVEISGEALLASQYNDRSDADKTALMHFVFSWIRQKYGILHKLRTQDVQAALDAFGAREAAVAEARAAFDANVVSKVAPVHQKAAEIKQQADLARKAPEELVADAGLERYRGIDGKVRFRTKEQDTAKPLSDLPAEYTKQKLVQLAKANPDAFRALISAHGQAAVNERLR